MLLAALFFLCFFFLPVSYFSGRFMESSRALTDYMKACVSMDGSLPAWAGEKNEVAVIASTFEKVFGEMKRLEQERLKAREERKVLENIVLNYGNVKEGVKSVMGGRILDYEAKRIKAEGLQEGRKEGQIETLVELVKDNLLSVQEAASHASLSEAGFREQVRKYGG